MSKDLCNTRIADDEREIDYVEWMDGLESIRVGATSGVTKIVSYGEPRECTYVAWLKVWKGDQLWKRMDTQGKTITYKIKSPTP